MSATKEDLANLFEFKVSLNRDGNVIIDYCGPPDPVEVEEAFDKWNEEYENTKKIVSLINYLKNYTKIQIQDIGSILR